MVPSTPLPWLNQIPSTKFGVRRCFMIVPSSAAAELKRDRVEEVLEKLGVPASIFEVIVREL